MKKTQNDKFSEIVHVTKIVLMIIVVCTEVILMPVVIAGEEGDRERETITGEWRTITELAGIGIADQKAKNWDPDAKLIKIAIWKAQYIPEFEVISTIGWQYFYRSGNKYLQVLIDVDDYDKNDTAKIREWSKEEAVELGLENLKPLSELWNVVSIYAIKIASDAYGISLKRGDYIGYLYLCMRDVKRVAIPMWHLSIVNGVTGAKTNYMINANTGSIIHVGRGRIVDQKVEISGFTEIAGMDIVDQKAKNWDYDAKLILIGIWKAESRVHEADSRIYEEKLNTIGWQYIYRSGNKYLQVSIDIDDYVNNTAETRELSKEEAVELLGLEKLNLKPLSKWNVVSLYAIKIASDAYGMSLKRGDYISCSLCMRDIKGAAIPVWHTFIGDGITGMETDYVINANTGEIISGGTSDVKIEFVDFESRVIKGQINVFEVDISNYGDYDVYGVIVEFKEGTKCLGNVTIPVLLAGEIGTVSYHWDTKDASPGIHEIAIEVRPGLFDEIGPKIKLFDSIKVKVNTLPPSKASTLIITNLGRMNAVWKNRTAELEEKLIKLSFHPSVNGIIVRVEEDKNCSEAYKLWESDLSSPEKANKVAKEIKNLIDSKLKIYSNVEYIIIVGDDRIIPYYRIPDNTDKPFGPESWYTEKDYHKLNTDSTVGSALHNNMFLADNFYATDEPIEWKTADAEVNIPELFIPSIPLSRLVETPEEISATIEAFYRKEYVRPDKIFVTAHDFMWDSALYCNSTLEEKTKTRPATIISRNDTEVTPDYFENVKEGLLNTSNDIALVFQHAEHDLFSVPKRREGGGIIYLGITSQDICNSTADLNGSIIYSMSCHAGLNVPPNSSINDFDLVQAFAQKGVVAYTAPTGFGIGSRRTRAAHELLISYFTRYLCEGMDVGTALTLAKQEYWATNYDFNYFDEQVLETTSLYGLPMVRINIPRSATSYNESEITIKSSVEEQPDTLVIRPTHVLMRTRDGDYYITPGGELLSDPRKPILPKEIRIFHPTPTRILRGAVMTSAEYRIDEPFKPLIEYYQKSDLPIELPTGEEREWFPARISKINSIRYPRRHAESRQYLIIITGQYKGPIGPSAKGMERIYDELSFDLYYASPDDETNPPSINNVSHYRINRDITITVNARDDKSGIRRVIITYTDINGTWGEWRSEDCEPKEGDLWTCNLPTEEDIEYFVQAVDNAGNVAIYDTEGQ